MANDIDKKNQELINRDIQTTMSVKYDNEGSYFDILKYMANADDNLMGGIGHYINSSIKSFVGETLSEEDGKTAAINVKNNLMMWGVPQNKIDDVADSFDTQAQADYIETAIYKQHEFNLETRSKYGTLADIGMTVLSDAPLMAASGVLQIPKYLGLAQKAAIGAKATTKAKFAYGAGEGAALGLGYEFATDQLQYGYDENYLAAAGFGAAGDVAIRGVGQIFSNLTPRGTKNNDIKVVDKQTASLNDLNNESATRSGIIESSIVDEVAVENIVLDSKTLDSYADAKIKYNNEAVTSLDKKVKTLNKEIKTSQEEIKTTKQVLKNIPDEIEKRKLEEKKVELQNRLKKANEVEVDNRAATQSANASIKKGDKVDETQIDAFVEKVTETRKKQELEKVDLDRKVLEEEVAKKEKELNQAYKVNSLEKKAKAKKTQKTFTDGEVKKSMNKLADEAIENMDTSKMSKRQIGRVKNEIKKRLNYNTDVLPHLQRTLKTKEEALNLEVNNAKSEVEKELNSFIKSEIEGKQLSLNKKVEEIENFYTTNNEKLLKEARTEFVNKKVPTEFKSEFGFVKAEAKKQSNVKKIEEQINKIDEKISLTSLKETTELELKNQTDSLNGLKTKKKKAQNKRVDLLNSNKTLNDAKTQINNYDYNSNTLKRKVPEMYDEILKDIEQKTDPDLVELGHNYVFPREVFGDGFKKAEITPETKIGGMPMNKLDDTVSVNSDEYFEEVGINVSELSPEQSDYLKENGSLAYKKKYVEYDADSTLESEAFKTITKDMNNYELNDDLNFLKKSVGYINFAQRGTNSTNSVVSNTSRFFMNPVTKDAGQINNNDWLIRVENLNRKFNTDYKNALDTYKVVAKENGIRIWNVEKLKEDIGIYLRDDANGIKDSTEPYDLTVMEVADNIIHQQQNVHTRAKASKHERYAKTKDNYELSREFDGNKISDWRSRVDDEQTKIGFKNAIATAQPDIVGMKTKSGKDFLDVLTNGYVDTLFKAKSGFNDFSKFMSSEKTVDDILELIESNSNNKDIDLFGSVEERLEVKEILLKRKEKQSSVHKSKMVLSESQVTIVKNKKGEPEEFKVADLLQNNVDILVRKTNEEYAGRITLAENGITYKEDFFQELKKAAKIEEEAKHATSGRSPEKNQQAMLEIEEQFNIIEAMLYGGSDIKGVSPNAKTVHQSAQVLKNITSATKLPWAFVSYLSETGKALSSHPLVGIKSGVTNIFDSVKNIKGGSRIYNKKTKKMELVNPRHRQYEEHFGFHSTIKAQALNKNQTDIGGIAETGGNKFLDPASYWSKKAANFTLSLNDFFEVQNRKIANDAINFELVKIAKDPEYKRSLFNKESLESFKFTEEKFETVMSAIRKNIKSDNGELYIDLDSMSVNNVKEYGDLLELHVAQQDQVVQRVSAGDKTFWETSQNPYLRTGGGIMAIFRTFGLKAIPKDLVRTLSQKNYDRFIKQTIGMTVGGTLGYYLTIERNALTKDDPEEYIEKMTSPDMLMKGIATRISYTGLLMGGADSVYQMIRGESMLYDSVRTSGLSSDFLGGNAVFKTVEDFSNVTTFLLKEIGINKGDQTKKELESITNFIPFSEVLLEASDSFKDYADTLSRYDNQTAEKLKRQQARGISLD